MRPIGFFAEASASGGIRPGRLRKPREKVHFEGEQYDNEHDIVFRE